MIPILGDVINKIGDIIAKVVPDADKAMDIKVQLAQLADEADARFAAQNSGQIDVDKIEASNTNLFVSGWRPFIGWICGANLAYTWMLAPLFHLQSLPAQEAYPIVTALLGLGTMRTFEKIQGVATTQPSSVSIPNPVQAVQSVASKIPVVGKWFHNDK